MGSTYRFISSIDEAKLILDWFRALDPCPVEQSTEKGVIFYFRELGPLSDDPAQSPVVTVFLPRKVKGVLTTAGEIHFLATPAKRFPALATVSRKFRKWISEYKRVHSYKAEHDDSYDYYLEGSLRNWNSDIFALPKGLEALKIGKYFVSDNDGDVILESLCRQIRLRGVEGIEEAQQMGAD
jgi:hypothetical protein